MEKFQNMVDLYIHILNVEGLEENGKSGAKDITNFAGGLRKVLFEELLQIVIEDVPHQYQERLIKILNI